MALKKSLLALVFIAFFLGSACAENLFYEASLQVRLNKESFAPGEKLEAEITLTNLENFPIPEAYLVVELVQGGEYYYPSQAKDTDNVFFEEKITGLNVAQNGRATATFTYVIPSGLKPGSYRLDAYAKTGKTHLVGAPHIFLSPRSEKFTVSGAGGAFPEAKFVRTKTEFHDFLGPVGPGINPGEEIKNTVFIQNVSGKALSDLTLFAGLCEWDDTSCESYNSTSTKKISSLKAGEEKGISVELTAPEMPDAYAIRLELRDSSGKLLSLYRNRSIVYGGTAKIHKLNVSDYLFRKGNLVELGLLLGSSPDHYTYPSFDDFSAKAWVEDMEDNNKVVFSESREIETLASNELRRESFSFEAAKELSLFKVCASVEKQGKVHERHCFVVDASKFPPKTEASEINVEWGYDFSKRELSLFFSNESPEITEMAASFLLMNFEASNLVASGDLKGTSPIAESFGVEPEDFVLLLNNFSTKTQKRVDITLKGTAAGLQLKSCAELSGSICASGQLCDNQVASSGSGVCCLTECKDRGTVQPPGFWVLPPVVFWAVLIVLVIAAAYVLYPRLGGRKEEKRVAGEILAKKLK